MYAVVRKFEEQVAEFAGAKYGIAVSSCSNAIFLSLLWALKNDKRDKIWFHIPKRTYPSIPCSIIHAGRIVGKKITLCWNEEIWSGAYRIYPYELYDSALRFRENMYVRGSLYCLSFHMKKKLPIGRGGMILTDDVEARDYLSSAKLDGRIEGADFLKEEIMDLGWNMYLPPPDGARGLQLFQQFKKEGDQMDLVQQYPDLSKYKVYKCT